MHTFKDWLRIEATTEKAVSALSRFATGSDLTDLKALLHAVQEIRHAAGQLGESPDRLGHENTRSAHAQMIDDDEQSLNRLSEALFKRT